MKTVNASYEILTDKETLKEYAKIIERAGRTCYKSEEKITDESAAEFIRKIIARGHLSVIEHGNVTVKFICDRGVTHEIVRHRLAAYSQESTRYVNYGGDDIQFIKPCWLDKASPMSMVKWKLACTYAEESYKSLLDSGWRPEQARSVLPNSLKTEIVMTANLREWLHVFTLRCAKAAHPQMREIMIPLLNEFVQTIPVIYDDIQIKLGLNSK